MGQRIIIMGVSGSGKTTVGKPLAERLNVAFLDADEFHPESNVAKMSRGEPLNDADRQPWLERLNRELRTRDAGCVLACSALKSQYRRTLEDQVPALRWVHLEVDFEVIQRRMRGREHFMPVELLNSQFQTLERPTSDEALIVDASQDVQTTLEHIVEGL